MTSIEHPTEFGNPIYRGFCVRVIDGDTFRMKLHLGFNIEHEVSIRLNRVNCPEIFSGTTAEKEQGQRAKSLAEGVLLYRPILVRTYKKSFDRFVADVFYLTSSGEFKDFGAYIVEAGYGTYVTG